MKLSAVKKKLGEVPAFVTYEFRGRDNALEVEGVPLTVELTPPSMAFILESGQITSLILRYSDTYKEQLDKIQTGEDDKPLKDKPEIAREIIQEMKDRIVKSEEEQSRMIGIIVKLGKEYLIQKANHGYYGNVQDRFKVDFVDTQLEATTWNEKYPDDDSKLVIWADILEDSELVNVGIRLMDAMPKLDELPANIPLLGDVVNPTNAELEKGVVTAVPADSVATFPRNLRSIVVEDVPERSRDGVGDSGGDKQTRK
jgi:hypothetical protein